MKKGTCASEDRRRPDLPLLTEAVLAWVRTRDTRFPLRAACAALANHGHRHPDVGRLLRTSPLFRPAEIDPSLPDEYRATVFRLTAQGQSLWDDLHSGGRAPIPTRVQPVPEPASTGASS